MTTAITIAYGMHSGAQSQAGCHEVYTITAFQLRLRKFSKLCNMQHNQHCMSWPVNYATCTRRAAMCPYSWSYHTGTNFYGTSWSILASLVSGKDFMNSSSPKYVMIQGAQICTCMSCIDSTIPCLYQALIDGWREDREKNLRIQLAGQNLNPGPSSALATGSCMMAVHWSLG